MVEKLKKMILDAVSEQYVAGYEAGYNARKVEEKDNHAHELLDLYRRGYHQGYEEAKAEVGEIEIDDLIRHTEGIACGNCRYFDSDFNYCNFLKEGVENEDCSCGRWEIKE